MVKELLNDYTVRMIRMEQRAAASLDKKVPYNETVAYKKLTKKQIGEFESYIAKKRKSRHIFSVITLLIYAIFGLFYFRLTGNVVRDVVGNKPFSIFGNIISILFFIVTAMLVALFVSDFLKEIRFRKHFKINDYLKNIKRKA